MEILNSKTGKDKVDNPNVEASNYVELVDISNDSISDTQNKKFVQVDKENNLI